MLFSSDLDNSSELCINPAAIALGLTKLKYIWQTYSKCVRVPVWAPPAQLLIKTFLKNKTKDFLNFEKELSEITKLGSIFTIKTFDFFVKIQCLLDILWQLRSKQDLPCQDPSPQQEAPECGDSILNSARPTRSVKPISYGVTCRLS